jgi:hypothetical protein
LKAVYDMIIECETINLTDFGDMYDAWNEISEVNVEACKKILGVTCYAANGTAQMDLDRDSRSRKIMHLIFKY